MGVGSTVARHVTQKLGQEFTELVWSKFILSVDSPKIDFELDTFCKKWQ